MTQYLVVRCRGVDTLPLMGALTERGLDGWTPRVQQRVRIPRRRKVVTLIRPAMPTFVFISESDVEEAAELAARWRIPQHKVFFFNGGPMAVDGMELLPLRHIDAPGQHNVEAPMLAVGTKVVVVTGPFVGNKGVVTSHDREYLCVCLENSQLDIKMTPFFVRPVPI